MTADHLRTRPPWLSEQLYPFESHYAQIDGADVHYIEEGSGPPPKDIAFREPERKRWEQMFPDHRTVMLEGAGHYIQEDAADEIVAAIRQWGERPR